MKLEIIEEAKLRWPDGAERTRIKDRNGCGRWREGWGDTRKRLGAELERLGATSVLITRHESEKLDPGVAVWFSRAKEDFSWQQGLGFDNPAPTAAKAWVTGTHGHGHEYVMAIDQYNEARLNLKALQMAFFYIRRLEDVGAPAILSQTLGAFRAKLVASVGGAA
jgi:hypothetical protein